MKVYYGWQRKNKIAKRDALCVYYLNVEKTPTRINKDGKDGVTQKIHVCYERRQTTGEVADAKLSNRIYTVFYIFLDDKKINNSLDKALDVNYAADSNNVSKAERERIKDALKQGFYKLYPKYVEPKQAIQLTLF